MRSMVVSIAILSVGLWHQTQALSAQVAPAPAEDVNYTQCINLPDSENELAIISCQMVAATVYTNTGPKKITQNFQAMKKGCDRGSVQMCSSLLLEAGAYKSPLYPELLLYAKSNCLAGNRRTCATLSGHYEDKKNMPEALKYAKMHFERFQDGPYIFLAYKHGDKSDAMKEALKECRRDNSRCTFYLRYMPDHPQYAEFIKYSERDCLSMAPYKSFGATSCTIAGAFHHKKNAHDKALGLWSRDCLQNGNRLACRLIIGSEYSSQPQKLQAVLQFCSEQKESPVYLGHSENQHCGEVKNNHRVPASFESDAKSLIQSFLQEQK